MDYMVELARHPDILEALELAQPRPETLLSPHFPRDEYPHAWVAELTYTFYRDPQLAAEAWFQLRYGKLFRRELAMNELAPRGEWLSIASLPRDVPMHVSEALKDGCGSRAVELYTQWLRVEAPAGRTRVDALCARTTARPSAPRFIDDLVDKSKIPSAQEAQIRRLLAHPEEVRKLAEERGTAVPFTMVLGRELDQIIETRREVKRVRKAVDDVPGSHSLRRALNANLLGLSFSGGGIRSATFNLGVLQALSKLGLLKECDYLSTVSGGGYIGGWLAAWIHRTASAVSPREAMDTMQRLLSPTSNPNPLDKRILPIRFLREYSNYLTPRVGFLSTDTWTMIGIYLRNTLLNQVIIISLFAAMLLLPRNWFALLSWIDTGKLPLHIALGLCVAGALLLITNLNGLAPPHNFPSSDSDTRATNLEDKPRWWARPFYVQSGVVLPWLLAAALVTHHLGLSAVKASVTAERAAAYSSAVVFILLLSVLMLGRTHRSWVGRSGRVAWVPALFSMLLAAAVAAVVTGGLVWVALRSLLRLGDAGDTALRWHLTAFGPTVTLSVLSLAIMCMLGMLGARFHDEYREWWSRFRTFLHISALSWAAWFCVALYAPWGIDWIKQQSFGKHSTWMAFVLWVGSTVFGVTKGRTAVDDRKQLEHSGARSNLAALARRWGAVVAPYVFVIGLILVVSLAIDTVYMGRTPQQLLTSASGNRQYWPCATWTSLGDLWSLGSLYPGVTLEVPVNLLATVGLLLLGLLFSWRVDINEFSVHHFYKNRLVRCYLGASHFDRKADWFTGFDPRDDLRLRDFDAATKGAPLYPGPYPIINCALNLVGGRDLAWQERKAASFVFTPKYCGYDLDRAVLKQTTGEFRSEAYVPTARYIDPQNGPLLGSAMALSGAAASPNMGRATSSASAFLMTVFNARLGWWIGNPRYGEKVEPRGPGLGLVYTALELFGRTDDRGHFVNVSDGGHFDNLGAYELIRRGCRYVIVCDAGQDANLLCEGLGNLVRKCRTDFGVEIDIALDRIRERDERGLSHAHCVVGTIRYMPVPQRHNGQLINPAGEPLVRGTVPAPEQGYLVYIKPSMTGNEPQDVLEYYRRIPEFPHQSTADQWFSESQFESYRKLGIHITEQVFGRFRDETAKPAPSVEVLFEQLYRYWHAPVPAISRGGPKLTADYLWILEQIRSNASLRSLDPVVFDLLAEPELLRQPDQLYACNALIQLMARVYSELDLENNWNHPQIEGWMCTFKRWVRTEPFKEAWLTTQSNYPMRFRNFYQDRLLCE